MRHRSLKVTEQNSINNCKLNFVINLSPEEIFYTLYNIVIFLIIQLLKP